MMAEQLRVDRDVCAGHGRCYTLVPEFFDSDEFGYPMVRSEVVPGDRSVEAATAVRNCPESAISIVPVS